MLLVAPAAALRRSVSASSHWLRPASFACQRWLSSSKYHVDIPHIPLLDHLTAQWPQYEARTALIDGVSGESVSYPQLQRRANSAAQGLLAEGFKEGDVLLLHSPNSIEYAVTFLAVITIGGVVSTSNPLYTSRELAHQISDSAAKYVFTTAAFEDTVKQGAEQAGKDVKVLLAEGGLCKGEQEQAPPSPAIDPSSLIALPYSSGTTGLPKGVMLSHANIVANLCQTSDHKEINVNILTGDVVMAVLPFFHIYGLVIVLLTSLRNGATCVIQPKFDPGMFLGCVQEHSVSVLPVVPPIVLFLAKHPVVEQFDLSSVRAMISGAAPLDADTEAAVKKRIDCQMQQGYGMTELSPVSHLADGSTPGSIGLAAPNTDAMIVDDSGVAVVEQEGELLVRGPQVMMGYLNNDEATKNTIRPDGFMHTGDLAFQDKDGVVFIRDRMKELIKVKGFQVAPAELEGLLLQHPSVADVAVVPISDERAGELPLAHIVLKEGAECSEEELKQHIRAQVAEYKQLHQVLFRDEIPKSASGKVLRRLLKK